MNGLTLEGEYYYHWDSFSHVWRWTAEPFKVCVHPISGTARFAWLARWRAIRALRRA